MKTLLNSNKLLSENIKPISGIKLEIIINKHLHFYLYRLNEWIVASIIWATASRTNTSTHTLAHTYTHFHTHTHTHTHIYIYIYISIEREEERRI